MLAGELPEHMKLGTIEGNFRCRWRVSRSGNTITVVARQKSGHKLRSRMAAVGRMAPRWETNRPPVLPKPIVPKKARMITFYKNGDPFYSGAKVSISPGKDFVSLDALYDYLTQRINIPHGVRYIFALSGRKVNDLDELLDGHSYVVSGTKNFQELAYGQGSRPRPIRSQLPIPLRKDDLKLLRPISPIDTRPFRDWRVRTPKNLRSRSLPAQNEGKTITVVNSQNPTIFSRVLLNMRTTQTFEEIVEDLGQAIKLQQATKLFNQSGEEVRSFSQLKHELKRGETFYIDIEENNENNTEILDETEEGYFSMKVHDLDPAVRQSALVQAGSLPNLIENQNVLQDVRSPEPIRKSPIMVRRQSSAKHVSQEVNGHSSRDRKRTSPAKHQNEVKHEPSPESPTGHLPNKRLELSWIHGYHGLDPARNLFILTTGELVYYVGAIAILHHHLNMTQRHYVGHTEDILCMALHTHDDILATGQGSGIDGKSQAHIRIWKADDLSTIAIVGRNHLDHEIVGVAFSWEGNQLMVMEGVQNTTLSIWDWHNDNQMTRAATNEELLGGCFHPLEDDLLVTYGKLHLAFWLKGEAGHLDRHDPLSAGRSGTTFLSIEFLSDGRLVTGNSRGFISIWSPSDDLNKIFYIHKEFKAHDGEVCALLTLPDGALMSGSSVAEQEGELRVWDSMKKFGRLASTTLPTGSGGVMSLCPQKNVTSNWEVYVGTNKNVIVEGSMAHPLNPVVHGHCDDVRALACHPEKPVFVTAGLDKYICRWEVASLIWKVQSDSECLSVAIHPHGSIVAVGDEHGDVTFLNMEDGLHVTTLPVTNNPLYTLKYSPDGDTLAVGCADGNIYLFQTHSNGYMYKIDFILPGTVPILMLDWSINGGYIQAVFTDSDYHDIVFWDLKRREKLQTASQVKDLDWFKPNCTLGYKINGMWNNKYLPDAVHICCHTSNSLQLLAAGDKKGFVRLFRYPCISERAAYFEEKQCGSDINAVQFIYNDKHLITTGGPDGAICVWKLQAAEKSRR